MDRVCQPMDKNRIGAVAEQGGGRDSAKRRDQGRARKSGGCAVTSRRRRTPEGQFRVADAVTSMSTRHRRRARLPPGTPHLVGENPRPQQGQGTPHGHVGPMRASCSSRGHDRSAAHVLSPPSRELRAKPSVSLWAFFARDPHIDDENSSRKPRVRRKTMYRGHPPAVAPTLRRDRERPAAAPSG